MQINVTVQGLDAIDLNTVIEGEVPVEYDSETGETTTRMMTLADLLAEKLAEKVWSSFAGAERQALLRRVNEQRLTAIEAEVVPIVKAAMVEPFRQSNAYGEPVGATVTLRDLVILETRKALGGQRDNYGRGDTLTQKVVRETVGAALTKELKDAVATEKEKVVTAVRAKAAELIAESVRSAIR